jgi:hypothetical protein
MNLAFGRDFRSATTRSGVSDRAYVRGPDNRPVLDLLMVSIDISNVRLARCA